MLAESTPAAAPVLENPLLNHLLPALDDARRWLARAGVAHVVTGGVAEAILWRPRLCRSVHVLTAAAMPPVDATAQAHGFETAAGALLHAPTQVLLTLREAASPLEAALVRRSRLVCVAWCSVFVPEPGAYAAYLRATAAANEGPAIEARAASPSAVC